MKVSDILKKLGFDVAGKESEIEKEFATLTTPATTTTTPATTPPATTQVDLSKLGDTETAQLLKSVMAQNQELVQGVKDLQTALAEEKSQRENAVKVATERAEAEQKKRVEDTIKKYKDANKIAEADVEKWTARLTKDFDEWNSELEAREVPKQFRSNTAKTNTGTQTNTDAAAQTTASPLRTLTEAIRENMDSADSRV